MKLRESVLRLKPYTAGKPINEVKENWGLMILLNWHQMKIL
ncbi:hypothetical protein [Caloramator sp. Dgby_cultured_2]|nr:hypothetical protein [Caloramator sp. Dgby_cultured_2]WDU83564.1 hypothetical protein PWK10_02645 [Caloramator sp. Dgby_cultured_2]